jgi:hypothetical protein
MGEGFDSFEEKPCRIFRDASWLQPLSLPPDGTPLCRKSDLKFLASFFQMRLEMVKPETHSFSASLEPENGLHRTLVKEFLRHRNLDSTLICIIRSMIRLCLPKRRHGFPAQTQIKI